MDTTAGLNQGGSLDQNVDNLENFILSLMGGMMRDDSHAALYFYACCNHELRTNAFTFHDYANAGIAATPFTPKEYYQRLIPYSFDQQVNDPNWLSEATDTDNPNLQFVIFDYRDMWDLQPGNARENVIVIILHSLAIAEDFVAALKIPEGVTTMVVSVGTINERATYLTRYYWWTAQGTFFYFNGFNTFADMDGSAFIQWLRDLNFPYTPLPVQ